MWRRRYWLVPIGAVICALAVLYDSLAFTGAQRHVQSKQARTVVIGGIHPCSSLPPQMVHGLLRYAAGTVLVLEGHTTWGKWRHGFKPLIFPKRVVARQTVRVNTMYRFALLPGRYVFTARLPHSNVEPFVQLTIKQGEAALHADIPNMCI